MLNLPGFIQTLQNVSERILKKLSRAESFLIFHSTFIRTDLNKLHYSLCISIIVSLVGEEKNWSQVPLNTSLPSSIIFKEITTMTKPHKHPPS